MFREHGASFTVLNTHTQTHTCSVKLFSGGEKRVEQRRGQHAHAVSLQMFDCLLM